MIAVDFFSWMIAGLVVFGAFLTGVASCCLRRRWPFLILQNNRAAFGTWWLENNYQKSVLLWQHLHKIPITSLIICILDGIFSKNHYHLRTNIKIRHLSAFRPFSNWIGTQTGIGSPSFCLNWCLLNFYIQPHSHTHTHPHTPTHTHTHTPHLLNVHYDLTKNV